MLWRTFHQEWEIRIVVIGYAVDHYCF